MNIIASFIESSDSIRNDDRHYDIESIDNQGEINNPDELDATEEINNTDNVNNTNELKDQNDPDNLNDIDNLNNDDNNIKLYEEDYEIEDQILLTYIFFYEIFQSLFY